MILSKQLHNQVTILNTNNLHTFIWYQVFLSNGSIGPIDRTLTDTTTSDQSGPGVMAIKR